MLFINRIRRRDSLRFTSSLLIQLRPRWLLVLGESRLRITRSNQLLIYNSADLETSLIHSDLGRHYLQRRYLLQDLSSYEERVIPQSQSLDWLEVGRRLTEE